MGHNTDQEEDAITVRAVAALVSLMPSTRTMEDFVSESDSDYTSYWRDWFISSRGNEYFCEIDEDYLTDRFNLTGLNTEVQYYQYALDLVTDVFDLDCDDDMRETIEKSARHLYGLVHARYIVTTRGLQKMLEKYKKADFGKCPRVMCQSHPLLPMGLSDVPQPQARQALLHPLRRHLQPKVVAPRRHRRRLLWHVLPQRPLPGLPHARARQEYRAIRTPCVRLQGARLRGPHTLAEPEEGRHATPPAQDGRRGRVQGRQHG
ncbi:casein kinase II subunit beta-2 [Verticillium dahliae VdLs.17]|uniref:Casein kinase II subunit beta n=1 Tax=Verticillium dahliae (strain VdLs.17 / ATCC MYA-4575 / FGSC 10137) TaxID=498257 RepID=G2XFA3_VERDV|nr:casein kinase II subunit beta-2 [Verticillium dahliae VdLs.17]EGY18501.1 casein kinase II subunit beta-2 [Verticillium dahliae VdLs.17]